MAECVVCGGTIRQPSTGRPRKLCTRSACRNRRRRQLADQPAERLVTADELAEYLSVDRSWVWEHADALHVRRLGGGPKARMRFSIAEVDALLTGATQPQVRRRRPTRELLEHASTDGRS